MNQKLIAVAAVVILIAAGVAAVLMMNNGGSDTPAPEGLVDAAGREIKVTESLENGIVTVGSIGPLRFLSCFDVNEHIIEVDVGDTNTNEPFMGRGYSYTYDYTKLAYHADNALDAPTVESIAKKNPSLVVVGERVWNGYQDNVKILATHTNVVVLEDPVTNIVDENGKVVEYISKNFLILGKTLDKNARAVEMIDGIQKIADDLKTLKGEDNGKTYVAGLTYSGMNPLNVTFPNYPPLNMIGATNAVDYDESTPWKKVLNIEDFKKLTFNKMLIDPSSVSRLSDTDSQLIMKIVYDYNNDSNPENDVKIYSTIPIVWDSINIDCALASAYYAAYVVNGTISEKEMIEKVSNVFELFYGENGAKVIPGMTAFFDELSDKNGQELPLMKEVKIVKNGDKYSFAEA